MRTTFVVAFLLSATYAPFAWAQSESGNVVTVLLPDRFRVSEEIATSLYDAVIEAVESVGTYEIGVLDPQTFADLSLTIGCSDDQGACAEILGEILETDYLIWGDVGGTDTAHLVELTFWSIADSAAVHRYTKAVEGDEDSFVDMLPTMARGVVYGSVGTLRIEVIPPDAEIEFDTHAVPGLPPINLTGLDLGPHVVTATHSEYFDYRETVVVDVDATTIRVEMVPLYEEIEHQSGRLWTWITLGSGVALTGAGVAFGLLAEGSQDDYDQRAAAVRVNQGELASLQDEGERNALLSNVFFAAGGAAIVASVILFFVESEGSLPEDDAADADVVDFGFHGTGFTLDIQF